MERKWSMCACVFEFQGGGAGVSVGEGERRREGGERGSTQCRPAILKHAATSSLYTTKARALCVPALA